MTAISPLVGEVRRSASRSMIGGLSQKPKVNNNLLLFTGYNSRLTGTVSATSVPAAQIHVVSFTHYYTVGTTTSCVFASHNNSGSTSGIYIQLQSADRFRIDLNHWGLGTVTTQVTPNGSGWYNFICVIDLSQAVQGNRAQVYWKKRGAGNTISGIDTGLNTLLQGTTTAMQWLSLGGNAKNTFPGVDIPFVGQIGNVYYSQGVSLDLSDPEVIAKFFNEDDEPLFLGNNGETPTGQSAIAYIHGTPEQVNLGAGIGGVLNTGWWAYGAIEYPVGVNKICAKKMTKLFGADGFVASPFPCESSVRTDLPKMFTESVTLANNDAALLSGITLGATTVFTTSTAHQVAVGQKFIVAFTTGASESFEVVFTATAVTEFTVTAGHDSSAWTPYVSGGALYRMQGIQKIGAAVDSFIYQRVMEPIHFDFWANFLGIGAGRIDITLSAGADFTNATTWSFSMNRSAGCGFFTLTIDPTVLMDGTNISALPIGRCTEQVTVKNIGTGYPPSFALGVRSIRIEVAGTAAAYAPTSRAWSTQYLTFLGAHRGQGYSAVLLMDQDDGSDSIIGGANSNTDVYLGKTTAVKISEVGLKHNLGLIWNPITPSAGLLNYGETLALINQVNTPFSISIHGDYSMPDFASLALTRRDIFLNMGKFIHTGQSYYIYPYGAYRNSTPAKTKQVWDALFLEGIQNARGTGGWWVGQAGVYPEMGNLVHERYNGGALAMDEAGRAITYTNAVVRDYILPTLKRRGGAMRMLTHRYRVTPNPDTEMNIAEFHQMLDHIAAAVATGSIRNMSNSEWLSEVKRIGMPFGVTDVLGTTVDTREPVRGGEYQLVDAAKAPASTALTNAGITRQAIIDMTETANSLPAAFAFGTTDFSVISGDHVNAAAIVWANQGASKLIVDIHRIVGNATTDGWKYLDVYGVATTRTTAIARWTAYIAALRSAYPAANIGILGCIDTYAIRHTMNEKGINAFFEEFTSLGNHTNFVSNLSSLVDTVYINLNEELSFLTDPALTDAKRKSIIDLMCRWSAWEIEKNQASLKPYEFVVQPMPEWADWVLPAFLESARKYGRKINITTAPNQSHSSSVSDLLIAKQGTR